jgi:hypothetical protein
MIKKTVLGAEDEKKNVFIIFPVSSNFSAVFLVSSDQDILKLLIFWNSRTFTSR